MSIKKIVGWHVVAGLFGFTIFVYGLYRETPSCVGLVGECGLVPFYYFSIFIMIWFTSVVLFILFNRLQINGFGKGQSFSPANRLYTLVIISLSATVLGIFPGIIVLDETLWDNGLLLLSVVSILNLVFTILYIFRKGEKRLLPACAGIASLILLSLIIALH